ncbi:unnamed protein product, partial [Laminaria digitata]
RVVGGHGHAGRPQGGSRSGSAGEEEGWLDRRHHHTSGGGGRVGGDGDVGVGGGGAGGVSRGRSSGSEAGATAETAPTFLSWSLPRLRLASAAGTGGVYLMAPAWARCSPHRAKRISLSAVGLRIGMDMVTSMNTNTGTRLNMRMLMSTTMGSSMSMLMNMAVMVSSMHMAMNMAGTVSSTHTATSTSIELEFVWTEAVLAVAPPGTIRNRPRCLAATTIPRKPGLAAR